MKAFKLAPLVVAMAATNMTFMSTNVLAADENEAKREKPIVEKIVKVDPELTRLGQTQQSLPVIVILSDQSHRALAKKIRSTYDSRIQALAKEVADIHRQQAPTAPIAEKDEERAHAKMVEQKLSSDVRERIKAINTRREALSKAMREEINQVINSRLTESQKTVVDRFSKSGAKVKERIGIMNAISMEIPSSLLDELAQDPAIAEISYDAPGKPELNNQTASLGVTSFWNNGYDGGVWDVGVLDSGVDHDHAALSSHTFYKNYSTKGSHGTGVACMYGSTNATYRGIAFGLDSIIVDNAGSASTSMAGADWMIRSSGDDAETINYSWGNGTASGSWGSMAKFVDAVVNDHDIVWAKSAGNQGFGTTTITQPGENYNALTVSNMDDSNTVTRSDDVIWFDSSRGPTSDGRKKPDLAAPGNNTYTCRPGGGWGNLGGTSSAAPKVGAASLLLRDAGHWDPMTMKAVLVNTADSWEDNNTQTTADDSQKTGREWNKTYGWGYLDLWHAHFHRNDYFRSSVRPSGQSGDYRLYKGHAYTGDKHTLVWEREVTYNNASTPTAYRNLSDIDLRLYRESNGSIEASDISVRDNVHQVAASSSGAKVVKVYAYSSNFDGASYEPFALATEEGFTAATGPRFSTSLTMPTSVFSYGTFTVQANVRNTGDLNAHAVTARLNLPSGFTLLSGPTTQSLGSVADGVTQSVSWTVRAPFTIGTYARTISVSVNSSSYGESFSGSGARTITVNGFSFRLP